MWKIVEKKDMLSSNDSTQGMGTIFGKLQILKSYGTVANLVINDGRKEKSLLFISNSIEKTIMTAGVSFFDIGLRIHAGLLLRVLDGWNGITSLSHEMIYKNFKKLVSEVNRAHTFIFLHLRWLDVNDSTPPSQNLKLIFENKICELSSILGNPEDFWRSDYPVSFAWYFLIISSENFII